MKFLQITDTHLIPAGGRLKNLDPEARLIPVFEDINRFHTDAEFCVITGDLADAGDAEAYCILQRELRRCSLPFHLLVGNHDHRESLLEHFPETLMDDNGFVQYAVETPTGVFLMLDTVEAETHAGAYCERRCDWLDRQLRRYDGQPIFLFMHHPPFNIYIRGLDRIGLVDKAEFAEVIEPHRARIRHLFFGHVHRPICGNWMGISHSSLRGTNHQVRLDFESEDLGFVDERPEYAVIFVDDAQVVVHTHQYPQPG